MERKYIYEGMDIEEYSKKKNISKFTIYGRIRTIKKENPNITNEEALKKVINGNINNKVIYFCNNETLYKYCLNNPKVNYNSIRSWVYNKLKKNPNQSIENLISFKLKGLNNKNRWFYLKIPLKEFCDKNNLSYEGIRHYLSIISKKKKYASWNDDEFVSFLIEKRFIINGRTLKEYCASINFPYETMHLILQEKIKKYPNIKFKTILYSTITTINQYRLTNYSKINNFNQEINEYLNDTTNTYLRNFYNLNRIRK